VASEEQQRLTVAITSPQTTPLTLDAREVIIPGRAGVFSVRPGHTPTLSTLKSGVLIITTLDGTDTHYAVHEGFVEILDDGVHILTPQFERGEQIDAARALEARERAEDLLARKEKDTDLVRAEAALHRAMARLGAHHGEGI